MTILFTNDWEKPENRGVIVDYETKNQSFVRYSALLREMGVKNHLWPLQLHDAGLQGVDPFDPNITPEMAVRVALESKRNFFYHIRELARDPSGSNEFPILFQANRGVMATYWLFFNHVLVLLIMIRQTGKTFGVDHLLTYLINIRLTKTEISYLTKDEKLRGREVDRLKAIELSLPEYLKQRTFRDPGNTEVFKIGSLDNSIKLYVPNRSPKLADLVGRGMTSPITVADEFAYLANSSITIPVMLAATLAAREVAQMKNDPYGNIFMTTSGKRDTPEGRYAYNFMQSCAEWNERLLDAADEQSLHDLVRKAGNGRDLRVNCTLNHRQLGKSDAWLRDRLRESAQEDQVQIEADFLNRWPSGTTFSPFSQETAEGIRNSEVLDPYINIDSDDAYAFRWYYKELEIAGKLFQAPHILSIDPSEQVGQDSIGVVLRNVFTGEVSMAADISEGNLIVFSKWIANFLVKNLNVLLIVERRSMGTAILDYVILFLTNEGIDPFRRIFNQVVQLAEEYPERFKEIQNPFSSRENLFIKYKKFFGWSTSGSGATSRTDLYSRTLSAAARMTGSLTRDRALILQILGLEIRNGRVDHGEGEHDDLCFIGSTLVRTITGNRPIKELKIGDLVLTRKGYRPILHIFRNEKEVISKFGLTGTPNHPFITPSGEVEFKDLTLESEVYVWNEKLSCIMEKTIIDILNPTDHSTETTFIDTIKTENPLLHFTDKFGKMPMDRFRKEWRSTTRTMTFLTITSLILSAFHQLSIERNIRCRKKEELQLVNELKKIILSQNGEKRIPKKPLVYMLKMVKKAKGSKPGRRIIQNFLKKSTAKLGKEGAALERGVRRSVTGENIIQKLLELLLVKTDIEAKKHCRLGSKIIPRKEKTLFKNGERITRSLLERSIKKPVKEGQKQDEPKKQLVYNLHVADCHEYFVNDILVHNCIAWLLSYWILSLGKNLKHYGIEPNRILTDNPTYRQDLKAVSSYDQEVFNKARADVEELSAILKEERDEYVAKRLEFDLERALSRLSETDRKVISADDLIHKLREERNRNTRKNTVQDYYEQEFGTYNQYLY